MPGKAEVLDDKAGHRGHDNPPAPRPILVISPRPDEAPSDTASMMEAYFTGKGELRKTPHSIRMAEARVPLLMRIMASTVTAYPAARMLRENLRPL